MSVLDNLHDYNLSGNIKFDVAQMNVGDYIPVKYSATDLTVMGNISEVGEVDYENMADWATTAPATEGVVYFMKIDKGTLISCARLFSTTYIKLNSQNLVHGFKSTLDNGKEYLVRIPTFNEFQLINNTLDGIIDRAGRDKLFGSATMNVAEWTQEMNASLQGSVANLYNTASTATAPVAFAANTTVYAAHLVLIYPDNDKSVDVFH